MVYELINVVIFSPLVLFNKLLKKAFRSQLLLNNRVGVDLEKKKSFSDLNGGGAHLVLIFSANTYYKDNELFVLFLP